MLRRGPILDKVILTITNFVAIIPLWYATCWVDMWLISAAAVSSILHHMAEVRYYEPALYRATPKQQWWLLQRDRIFAVAAILGLGSFNLLFNHYVLITTALVCLLIAEVVMYIPDDYLHFHSKRHIRVFSHSLWHILAEGVIAYLAVTHCKHEPRFYQYINLL
jgi:hypothetical protein